MLGAALVCVACSEKEEPAGNNPVVRTIRVEVSSLEILPGESAILPFSVEDKEASLREVKLLLDGGKEPREFFIKEIVSGPAAGSYEAVIADAGMGGTLQCGNEFAPA